MPCGLPGERHYSPSLLGMSLGRAHASPQPKLFRLSSLGAGFSHFAPGTYLAGLSVEVGLRPAVVIFGVKEVDQAALAGSVSSPVVQMPPLGKGGGCESRFHLRWD